MHVGLDIGTSNIRLAVQESGDAVVYEHKTAILPISDSLNANLLLSKFSSSYLKIEDTIYITGNDALNLSNVFSKNTLKPLENGLINSEESNAKLIIEGILSQLFTNAKVPEGSTVVFAIPANPVCQSFNNVYHKFSVESILAKLGMKSKVIYNAQSSAYFDLMEDDITGISINIGAGLTNVCCSYLSIPAVNFSFTTAGDWIDTHTARALNVPLAEAIRSKESLNAGNPVSEIEWATHCHLTHLVDHINETLNEQLISSKERPRYDAPIKIVLSGSMLANESIALLFTNLFKNNKYPFPIKDISVSLNPKHGSAIGCLLTALHAEEGEDIVPIETTYKTELDKIDPSELD